MKSKRLCLTVIEEEKRSFGVRDKTMMLSNRYRIIQQLQSGGCAATFLAEDLFLPSNRKCVVKQFKPAQANQSSASHLRDKFKKEAEVLELLGNHDLIPELYAFFEENGELFICQQWIEGLTLTDKIHLCGRLDDDFVRDFLVCVLTTLEFVHSNGVIHRDIKPNNIILRQSDGMPVLIDFGIVKDLEDTVIGNNSNALGTMVGSKGYSSPKQMAGHSTYSNDLFSLGMVAIFLLTGQPPTTFIDPYSGLVQWWLSIPNWQTIHSDLFNTIQTAINQSPKVHFSTAEQMKDSLYNSKPGQCRSFAPHVHTPFMWKQIGSLRTSLINTEYDDAMELHSEDSDAFQRGKLWRVI
jgi:serine/threonine protein kinase, bacterial